VPVQEVPVMYDDCHTVDIQLANCGLFLGNRICFVQIRHLRCIEKRATKPRTYVLPRAIIEAVGRTDIVRDFRCIPAASRYVHVSRCVCLRVFVTSVIEFA